MTSANTDIGNDLPLILYGQDQLTNPTKNYLSKKKPLNNYVYSWNNQNVLEQCDINMGDQFWVGVGYTLDQEGSKTYTTGCKDVTGTVLRNSQSLPAAFLDCPSLQIENSTGTSTFGYKNNYICPIVYPTSAAIKMGDQMLYNTIKSSYEQRITSLKLRICIMNGQVAKDMAPYTWGCLEIREDPQKHQKEFFQQLLKIAKKDQQSYDTLEPQKWDKQWQ